MTLRRAHGTGAPAISRVETLPADELPPLDASDTATGTAIMAGRGKPFQRGNRAAAGRRPALASAAGIPLEAADPDYQRALRWARRYRRRRVQELTIQHGGSLSSGVCAMLTSSALDMAASRYLTARAAATGDHELLSMASRLAMTSRQQELTALEIASREAAAVRAAAGPVDPLARWRLPGDPTT